MKTSNKKFISLLLVVSLIFAVFPGRAHAAFLIIQDEATLDDSGTTSGTIAKTFSSNVTKNNLIVVMVAWSDVNQSATIGDTVGTSFQQATAKVSDVTADQAAQMFYGLAGDTGADTITVNFSNPVGFRRLIIVEISGTTVSNVLDGTGTGQVQNKPGTAADAISSGDITPSVSGDFVIGFVQDTTDDDPGAANLVEGTNYTLGSEGDDADTTPEVTAYEYRTYNSLSPVSATFTHARGNVERYTTLVAAFKPLVTGAGRVRILMGKFIWMAKTIIR